ncbi:hypothetical protein [Arthrobacter silvisoli]|nr:hypothetical protein [Arthrobacter silvisoli]
MSHVWPGITPLNVYDLTYTMWIKFVLNAQAWEKAQAEARQKK